MSSPREHGAVRELTSSDAVSWNEARLRAIGGSEPSGRFRQAGRWIWYFVLVFGWAAGVSEAVVALVGERWQIPAAIVAVVFVSGAFARSDANDRRAHVDWMVAAHATSVLGQADIRLRIDDEAVQITYGQVLYRFAWSAVTGIHSGSSVIVIACDGALTGIAVLLSASRKRADADAFRADLKARATAAGGIA